MQSLPRPLTTLISSQLRPLAFAPPRASASTLLLRRASTSAPVPSTADKQKAMQDRQMRLMEKAGRIKQSVGSMSGQLPAFANFVRPTAWSKRIPEGTPYKRVPSYLIADGKNFITNYVARNSIKKALGKGWFDAFNSRALEAYAAINEAFATGRYSKLDPYASTALLDTIKAQRSNKFQGLQMSWKLQRVVRQEVACARAQELMKKGNMIAQITVRFVTIQSLEIRNSHGDLIQGDHSKPKEVTEYYCFQRDLWIRNEDWRCIKKLQEVYDPFNDPDLQM